MSIKIDTQSLESQAASTLALQAKLRNFSLEEKLSYLIHTHSVKDYLANSVVLNRFFEASSPDIQYVLAVLLAIGQGDTLFFDLDEGEEDKLRALVQGLVSIEHYYQSIGGIVGYHLNALQLILALKAPSHAIHEACRYQRPEGVNLEEQSVEVRRLVRLGIEHLSTVADFYPIGGAGDRLHLEDASTGEPLPAAQLLFCGRTLLEGLVRELQGREYLHYKFFAKQLHTPIVMMTSAEKKNHDFILEQCRSHAWFGRDPQTIKLMKQLSVPMIATDGSWVMQAPLELLLKPGGHGVIWQEALHQGIFDWLASKQRSKALVRQINNPIAATDKGILALLGLGCQAGKDFGFACCSRILGAPEGTVVLKMSEVAEGVEHTITNIEYTDFAKRGIEDKPLKEGSPYSQYPANANILVADLAAVKLACQRNPFPGLLINVKHSVSCYTKDGVVEKQAGRLEAIMQNIADQFVTVLSKPIEKDHGNQLRTCVTYSERIKTISVTKQSFKRGEGLLCTPEGCFFDLMENYRDLLSNHCHFQLPEKRSEKEYIEHGPSFVVEFHPALGMLYTILAQKIRGGRLHEGAEWLMEVGEAYVENLDLEGSLLIHADAPMGKRDGYGILRYNSAQAGKCTLLNVSVKNAGADLSDVSDCYKRAYKRNESLRIVIHGNGEFLAENVTLTGDMEFEVPENHRLVVYERHGEITWHHESLSKPTWQWNYSFDSDENITLFRE